MDKSKLEYKYTYVTGDTLTISLEGSCRQSPEELQHWIKILRELDRIERNVNKRETRRHCSLEAYDRSCSRLIAPEDGFGVLEERELWREMRSCLTRREEIVAELYFLRGYKVKEITKIVRLGKSQIYDIIRCVREKLAKYYYG